LIGNLPIKASGFDSFEWHAGLPERRFPMAGFVTCLQALICHGLANWPYQLTG
jgi:hypothetical protein